MGSAGRRRIGPTVRPVARQPPDAACPSRSICIFFDLFPCWSLSYRPPSSAAPSPGSPRFVAPCCQVPSSPPVAVLTAGRRPHRRLPPSPPVAAVVSCVPRRLRACNSLYPWLQLSRQRSQLRWRLAQLRRASIAGRSTSGDELAKKKLYSPSVAGSSKTNGRL